VMPVVEIKTLWVSIASAVPMPMAARSKAWVCGRSFVGIVGSNPARGA
jgi:hypothetical protein